MWKYCVSLQSIRKCILEKQRLLYLLHDYVCFSAGEFGSFLLLRLACLFSVFELITKYHIIHRRSK